MSRLSSLQAEFPGLTGTPLPGDCMDPYISCTVMALPAHHLMAAAATAIQINPANRPSAQLQFRPEHLALLTAKYWGAGGVKLTVGFVDGTAANLQSRILAHMNAWGAYCNAVFVLSNTSPQVRIARGGSGYWSYLGTDVLHIPAGQPTMNLQGFTMTTPESEYHRVVRHETGHTLGFPHEHMRREIVQRINPQAAINYFGQTQGWDAQTVTEQVLTPLEESSLMQDAHADVTSIMCYGLPGLIMTDGQAVPGGSDIEAQDQAFAGKVYPKAVAPPPPPPPPPSGATLTLPQGLAAGTYQLVKV